MLSDHEQWVLAEIERSWGVNAEEPRRSPLPPAAQPRRPSRDPADLPAMVAVGALASIMLVLFGAPVAGLAVGAATTLGWALWRCWPQLRRSGARATSPAGKPWQRRREKD